jgi:mono/diheme cytochrome c family protein
MSARLWAVLVGATAALGMATALWLSSTESASDPTLGRELYALHCAGCHGADLKGEPNWQTPLPGGRMPAPPLNAAGHASHHSESELFQIVKYGMASMNGGKPTDMPAFEDVLSDKEILAVLTFLKASW